MCNMSHFVYQSIIRGTDDSTHPRQLICFYYVLTTFTTVGYGEFRPHHDSVPIASLFRPYHVPILSQSVPIASLSRPYSTHSTPSYSQHTRSACNIFKC